MRSLILIILLASASIANATSSKEIRNLKAQDQLLTVKRDGSVVLRSFQDVTSATTVLVRSDCVEFDGNTNEFKNIACLVKEELGSLSIKKEVAVD